MTIYRNIAPRSTRRCVIMAVAWTLLVLVLIFASVHLMQGIDDDMTKTATQSIRRAVIDSAVQCYAVEGAYPSTMDYLESNYGLQINHEDYIVSYEAFASNVAPDVRVLVRGQS